MKQIIAVLLLITSSAYPCTPIRTTSGKIARSTSVVTEFKRTHICPGTGKIERYCHGYVVDHIIPLACCGSDITSNMQYQTIAEGKAKDKWERKACGGD